MSTVNRTILAVVATAIAVSCGGTSEDAVGTVAPETMSTTNAVASTTAVSAPPSSTSAVSTLPVVATTTPSDSPATVAAERGWSFTDDLGNTIELAEPPEVIVAPSAVAGTLWEYGVEIDAVYGPLRGGDGEPDPQLGLATPADLGTSLGEEWGQINLEAMTALEPDLIIDAMWGGQESLQAHPQWELLQEIGPHAAIEVVDTEFAAIPERFAELALALGGDRAKIDAARGEFEAARERLRQAASNDLSVAFVTAETDLFYVGLVEGFTDLQYFDQLGMSIVQLPASDLEIGGVVYWTELSWERAGEASADVMFVDSRTYSDINAILDDHPTWTALPARATGQVGDWDVEPGYGYGNLARLFNDMATTLEQADDVTE